MPSFGKRAEHPMSATRVRMHWQIAVCIVSISCIATAVGLTVPDTVLGSNGDDDQNDAFDLPDVADMRHASDNVERTYPFKSLKIHRTFRVFGASFSGTSVGGTSPDCAPGFTRNDAVNSCYKPMAKAMTWDEAASACRSAHPKSHLAFIDSSQEQQAVTSMLAGYNDPVCTRPGWGDDFGNGWWIGFQRLASASSTFVAKSGSSPGYDHVMSYSNWKPGQPDNGVYSVDGSKGNENCVHLTGASSFQWNDATCHSTLCFVCEIALQ